MTMPVEIKELVIRAVVHQQGERASPAPPAAGESPIAGAAEGEEDREAIVQAAVKEVLRILKASKER
jgi:hypothetical protein